MKRTLTVLAVLTLIVPGVAHAQTLRIPSGNNRALGQIVSSVIEGLTRVPYGNQYSQPQIRQRYNAPSAWSSAYQNGYAQGAADARRAAQYNQYGQYGSRYGANSGYQNQYRQNFGDRDDRFQRNVRGSWRGGY